MRIRAVLVVLMAVFAAGVLAACGDEDDEGGEEGTTAAQTATATGTGAVTVEMGDYFFDPKDLTAEAGSLTVSAPNVGEVEHELVLFKSDADPASLPVAGGKIDEEALEEDGAEEAGEIEEVEPGQSGEHVFELTPGKYVMFCNIPAHYEQGMYGSLTVK